MAALVNTIAVATAGFSVNDLVGTEIVGFPTKKMYFDNLKQIISDKKDLSDKFLPMQRYIDAIIFAKQNPGQGLAGNLIRIFGISEKQAASFIHWAKTNIDIKQNGTASPTIYKHGSTAQITPREGSYDILTSSHSKNGIHGGVNTTLKCVQSWSSSITKDVVAMYVGACPTCTPRVDACRKAYGNRDPLAPRNGREAQKLVIQKNKLGHQMGPQMQQQGHQLPPQIQDGYKDNFTQHQQPLIFDNYQQPQMQDDSISQPQQTAVNYYDHPKDPLVQEELLLDRCLIPGRWSGESSPQSSLHTIDEGTSGARTGDEGTSDEGTGSEGTGDVAMEELFDFELYQAECTECQDDGMGRS